jgi:acetyl esterase/lipase
MDEMGEVMEIFERAPVMATVRVPYGEAPQQFGDLFLPERGTGPFPAVIAIHGGFWRNAYGLEHLSHLCQSLTRDGIAVWSLEYRRLGDPGGGWPGTFQDVARGAAHLWTIGKEHRIDTGNVTVLGHSAGGHLAVWLASLANAPKRSEIAAKPLPLHAAISLAGVLDLRRARELRLSDNVVETFLGGTPAEVPDRYAATSPIALLPAKRLVALVHGTNDTVVPAEISRAYRRAANAAGDPAILMELPGCGHNEPIDPSSPWGPVIATLVRGITGASV